jgi:DNA transformation protein
MFALIASDTLYLKADEKTKADFESEGMKPFTYKGKGKPVSMSYWELPEALYDDPDNFVEWARIAFEVELKAKRK